MTWSPISYGLSLGDKEDNIQLFEKLSIKNHKSSKNVDTVMLPPPQTTQLINQPTSISGIAQTSVRINDGAGTPAGNNANSVTPMDVTAVTHTRIKALTSMAEKMGCNLSQLAIAWCLRNSTSQSVVASANSTDQLLEILGSLPVSFEISQCFVYF